MFRRPGKRKPSASLRSRHRSTAKGSWRPRVEELEGRLVPATHTWSGAVSVDWSDSRNWREGTTPFGDSFPDLVFPSSGVTNFVSRDDSSGTTNINSIRFDGNGFTINNRPLFPGSLVLFGNITANNTSGINTIAVDVGLESLGSDGTIHANVAAGGTLAISGAIGDAGTSQLAKDGGGGLQLQATNRYTGARHINQGTLYVGANNAVPPTSRVLIGEGAYFDVSVYTDAIASLADGPGFVGGSVILGGVFFGSGFLVVGNDNTSTTYSGVISGRGTVSKFGTGTLTLSGRSTFSGTTLINQGTLSAGTDFAFSSASSISLAAGATLDCGVRANRIGSLSGAGHVNAQNLFYTGADNSSTTFSGAITGTNGRLLKEGTGTFTMAGASNYTAATFIQGGTLRAGGETPLPPNTAVIMSGNSTLDVNGHNLQIGSLEGPAGTRVTIGSGTFITGFNNQSTTFSGVISNSTGVLYKQGTGTFTLSGPNTYSGWLSVLHGSLQLGVSNALPTNAWISLDNPGAVFDVNNLNATIARLSGVAGTSVRLGSGALTISDDGTLSGFSGIISGTGSLNKSGNGSQTLSGDNTYSGLTNLNAGTLVVNGAQPTSTVAVANGATLSGSGTAGFLAVSGTIQPGFGGTSILHSGTAVFNGGSAFRVSVRGTTAGASYDQLNSSGNINIGGNPTLSVSMGFSSTVGDQFVIMVASGTLSGNFSGLQEGQVFAVGQARFQIHYTANSVILIHVSDSATNLQVAASTISQAGEAFDVTVIAADGGGHPDPLYSGTVHFSSQDPYGARLPVDYTFTSADHGQHTFSGGATLFTAGTWDVTSTDSAAGIGGSTNVRVIPGPAFSLAVTAPSSTPSGSAFDITITAQDLYGNTNTNYQGTVTFSTSDTDPGVVLPADYAFQASDQGSVTFGGGVTLITPGDQQIGVRDPMSGIIGSATVTVTNGGSPRGGGRGRIFLPWMGAASERAPTILSPSAICITAPENPWVANAELVGPEPFKGNVASLAFVRGAWTEGAADRAIDLFFSEDPS